MAKKNDDGVKEANEIEMQENEEFPKGDESLVVMRQKGNKLGKRSDGKNENIMNKE